jgi:hypothetical protein|tara:strand:+ start:207 stop:401 length:195 start_codon:yes stop_codon:yes gene_type:complete
VAISKGWIMARYFEITLEVYSHRIKYSMSTQGLQNLDFTNLLCNQRRQELNAGIFEWRKREKGI